MTQPRSESPLRVGDTVEIINGDYTGRRASVDEVDEEVLFVWVGATQIGSEFHPPFQQQLYASEVRRV